MCAVVTVTGEPRSSTRCGSETTELASEHRASTSPRPHWDPGRCLRSAERVVAGGWRVHRPPVRRQAIQCGAQQGPRTGALHTWSGFGDQRSILHHADPAPECFCSPNQLRQVIVNLIVNAIQAIGERGKIQAVTGRDGDHVFARIDDDGQGMTETILNSIRFSVLCSS